LIAYHEYGRSLRSRFLPLALTATTLTYQVLTASRTGALILLFGLCGISWMKARQVKVRTTLLAALVAVLLFAGTAVALDKGGSRDATFQENVVGVTTTARLYLLGGVVAFDNYARGAAPAPDDNLTLRAFVLISNATLGTHYPVASLVLDRTDVPESTNVYTLYYPYFADYGWLGVLLFPAVVGFGGSLLFARARRGSRPAVILYGMVIAAILLTVGNETFFTSASAWIQAFVYAAGIYALVDRRARAVGARDSARDTQPLTALSGKESLA
jgi:oligosaccharide repeat unit polymerase